MRIVEHFIPVLVEIRCDSAIYDAFNIFERIDLAITLYFLWIFAPFNKTMIYSYKFKLASFTIKVSFVQKWTMLACSHHLYNNINTFDIFLREFWALVSSNILFRLILDDPIETIEIPNEQFSLSYPFLSSLLNFYSLKLRLKLLLRSCLKLVLFLS